MKSHVFFCLCSLSLITTYSPILTLGKFNIHIDNSSNTLYFECFSFNDFFFLIHFSHSFPLLILAWLLPTIESSHLKTLIPCIPLSSYHQSMHFYILIAIALQFYQSKEFINTITIYFFSSPECPLPSPCSL